MIMNMMMIIMMIIDDVKREDLAETEKPGLGQAKAARRRSLRPVEL